MCSFLKSTKVKNTTKYRANSFGFYSLNSNSTVEFREHSRKENIADFLELIRKENDGKKMIIILSTTLGHTGPITYSGRQMN